MRHRCYDGSDYRLSRVGSSHSPAGARRLNSRPADHIQISGGLRCHARRPQQGGSAASSCSENFLFGLFRRGQLPVVERARETAALSLPSTSRSVSAKADHSCLCDTRYLVRILPFPERHQRGSRRRSSPGSNHSTCCLAPSSNATGGVASNVFAQEFGRSSRKTAKCPR